MQISNATTMLPNSTFLKVPHRFCQINLINKETKELIYSLKCHCLLLELQQASYELTNLLHQCFVTMELANVGLSQLIS